MKNWLRSVLVLCLLPIQALADDMQGLLDAITNKNVEQVVEVLKQGADVNQKLANGTYPIIAATEFSTVEVMKVLTAGGADVMVRDEAGATALHLAARMGAIDKIQLLLSFKVPMNEPDSQGVTPLYYAWLNEQLDAADYMIESENARVNMSDVNGNPLAFRVVEQSDNVTVLEHMIGHKLNILKRNQWNKMLRDVAKAKGHKESEALLQKSYEALLKTYEEQLKQKKVE